MTRRSSPTRPAFTLVELLTTIAIVGVLSALLLPAVQSAREASRRTVCFNHMRQVALATLNYESSQGELPATWQAPRRFPWDNFSWRTAILPFIEQQSMYDRLALDDSPWTPEYQTIVQQPIDLFQCPSTPKTPREITELGAHGQRTDEGISAAAHDLIAVHGVAVTVEGYKSIHPGAWSSSAATSKAVYSIGEVPLTESLAEERTLSSTVKRITDGLSNTILLTEQAGKPKGWGTLEFAQDHFPSEGAWATCDYGVLFAKGVNTHNFYDPFGFHEGAAIALCDGSVKMLSEDTPTELLVALATRARSEIASSADLQH